MLHLLLCFYERSESFETTLILPSEAVRNFVWSSLNFICLPASKDSLSLRRQDIPKYRVWRDGKLAEEREDIREIWDAQKDMVGFLLGCSFSWENVLKEAGLCPRQIEEGKNVPMYRTVHPNYPVGPFTGELVVSMRPY